MSACIRRLGSARGASRTDRLVRFGPPGGAWTDRAHLSRMDIQRTAALGLDPLLTTSELADYLGVQVQAIYDLRSAGRGPTGVRIGRELRYRVSDLRTWLDSLPDGAVRRHTGGVAR